MSKSRAEHTGDSGDGMHAALHGLDVLRENLDARRKDALYRLTDRLYHASSLDDVHASALEAIICGLDCDRASILLFDDAQVMRFVAATGLSESYQKAVEGHSPWAPDETDPAPVCMEDVETAEIPPALRRTIQAEGIGAAAFIPLVADGRLIGKFMAYFDRPHDFSRDDLALSVTIARQLAFAIERRQSEQALVEQKRLYEAILANTPDLAYVFDLDHRFIYANEGLLKMWGRTWEQAVDRTCLELGYEPWHAAMHDREIEQVIATRQPVRGEVPFTGTFGRRIYDYLFVPVFGSDGAVVAVAGTTRDVTELKDNEDRLREADRRKDEFLAMLAHELRNPLAPIAAAVHILKLDSATQPLRQQARDIIERQVRQLTRLVDDLLEVSRITTGRIQLRREWISVGAVVERAEETVRSIIEKHGHVLTVCIASQPCQVHADGARLEQVLVNLLNNAAKYTPQGGRIGVTVRSDGSHVEIAVRDSGVGIEPDLLPRIFHLFTQAERSLNRSEGGLGVGLALSRSLVELHGGTLGVASEVGKGSEFTIRLPASAQPDGDLSPG
jgi:PAS domain S-box-containing protein